MKLKEFSIDERIELLKNKYIYDVTKTCILFTEEGKEKLFEEYKNGKSTRKILTEMGIKTTEIVISKTRHLRGYLNKEYKRKGNFKRKHFKIDYVKPINISKFKDKTKEELATELELRNQEIDFLKKITDATK